MFLDPQRHGFVALSLETEMDDFAGLEVVNSGATAKSCRGTATGQPRKRNRRQNNSDEESDSDHSVDSEEEKLNIAVD